MVRMGRRGDKAALYESAREPTGMREALERRWYDRLTEMPHLATLVTANLAQHEPYHRWMHYKQGFSPGLVRLFLKQTADTVSQDAQYQVLDPFSGSGTTVIECARRKISAIGTDALPWLTFLTRMTGSRLFPPLPDLDPDKTCENLANVLEEDIHRAALMLAVVRQFTTAGKINKGAPPLSGLFEQIIATMQEDLTTPLPSQPDCQVDDARSLASFDDASCGSVLCSPPYISQHDYRKIASPYETVYKLWYNESIASPDDTNLMASHPKSSPRHKRSELHHSAQAEARDHLIYIGEKKIARVVDEYFHDMKDFLQALRRVVVDGAECWIVIGGARPKGVYIPSDLILAEMAEKSGFTVESLCVARELVSPRRKFGHIGHVAPRETVLILSAS